MVTKLKKTSLLSYGLIRGPVNGLSRGIQWPRSTFTSFKIPPCERKKFKLWLYLEDELEAAAVSERPLGAPLLSALTRACRMSWQVVCLEIPDTHLGLSCIQKGISATFDPLEPWPLAPPTNDGPLDPTGGPGPWPPEGFPDSIDLETFLWYRLSARTKGE